MVLLDDADTKGKDMSETYKTKILHLSHGDNGCLAIRASAITMVSSRDAGGRNLGCTIHYDGVKIIVKDGYDELLRQLGWEEDT